MKDDKLIDIEEDIEQKFGCTYKTKIIQYNRNFRLMTVYLLKQASCFIKNLITQ